MVDRNRAGSHCRLGKVLHQGRLAGPGSHRRVSGQDSKGKSSGLRSSGLHSVGRPDSRRGSNSSSLTHPPQLNRCTPNRSRTTASC